MNIQEERYERMRSTPLYWYNHSSDLRASAAALDFACEKEISDRIVMESGLGAGFLMGAAVGPVYAMLWGMSFELLFKGIAIARGKKFPPNHILEQLAEVAEFPCNAQEIGILNYLTESIIWDGRYPVPLGSKSGGSMKAVDNMEKVSNLFYQHLSEPAGLGQLSFRKYNGGLDWANLNLLWQRGAAIFFQLID